SAEFLAGQIGFVFPGEQHVADLALCEGYRGTTGAGVEYRSALVELADIGLDLVLVALELFIGPGPGREIVPARTARGLRVRGHDLYVALHQIAPVTDALRVTLANEENDGGGVRGGIMRQAAAPVL